MSSNPDNQHKGKTVAVISGAGGGGGGGGSEHDWKTSYEEMKAEFEDLKTSYEEMKAEFENLRRHQRYWKDICTKEQRKIQIIEKLLKSTPPTQVMGNLLKDDKMFLEFDTFLQRSKQNGAL